MIHPDWYLSDCTNIYIRFYRIIKEAYMRFMARGLVWLPVVSAWKLPEGILQVVMTGS